uniref:RNA-directed RNA polymerase n=1 Tax=Riboviria sp. TaxID=2585031 RepID=A0A8K1WQL9_9VIRU|nr:MAG: hypothetical protein 1 [Riboviria sp.]
MSSSNPVLHPMRCPFGQRARLLMPGLLHSLPAIPARTHHNMEASLRLRVLHPPVNPLRLCGRNVGQKANRTIQASVLVNHPSGSLSHLQTLLVSGDQIEVPVRRVAHPEALLPSLFREKVGVTVDRFIDQKLRRRVQTLEPMLFDQWVSRYPLNRQLALSKARESLLDRGNASPTDARVENFLKYEVSTTMTDPRNISPRGDAFLSVLGPYISALEHNFCKLPFLVKGIGLDKRHAKITRLGDYSAYIETDYSRFDMTISEEVQRLIEYRLLTYAFNERDHPLFHALMSMTWKTKGNNEFDIAYATIGGRCSGDAHTSLGNGLLNYFMTWAAFENAGFDWISYHEGDDGIIGLPRESVGMAADLLTVINTMGFKVKSVVSEQLEDTTFCGRWLINIDGQVVSFADVPRTLGKFNVTTAQGKLQTLLVAKALSYYHTDRNTPIIGPLCQAILKIYMPGLTRSARKRAVSLIAGDRFMMREEVYNDSLQDEDPCIRYEARWLVEHRGCYTISAQLQLEKTFLDWVSRGAVPLKFQKLLCGEQIFEADDRHVIIPPEYYEHL